MSSADILLVPGPSGEPLRLDLAPPYRGRDALLEAYWRSHPRFLFVKNAPRDGRLLDIGAGPGGLVGWKHWGEPDRSDLALYAVDVEKGEWFDLYADYDIVEVGPDETKYDDASFDAIVCSHVLQYVCERDAFAHEVARIAQPGAKIYVEWPRPQARPISRASFQPFGIECGPLGTADDPRQIAAITDAELDTLFEDAGCRKVAGGVIENDYLFPELCRNGVREGDGELTTYGVWLFMRLASYAIFEKPANAHA